MNRVFQTIEPARELPGRIHGILARADAQNARTRRLLSLGALLLSALAFVAASMWLYADSAQSGFSQAISLGFSDSSVIATYWSDFVSTMLETLPYASLAAFLASVFAILLSFRSLALTKNYKQVDMSRYA